MLVSGRLDNDVRRHVLLAHLSIRDFTIVDRVELDLGGGLTALTGETGAGKSILVDALVLALGARASPDVVRTGQERAEITAVFDLSHTVELSERLRALALDTDDGECIVRRIVSAEGRSRAFVNGRPVPNQTLRDLTQGVIEVHGQHAHHSLLGAERQRELLDNLGGYDGTLETVGQAFQALRTLEQERDSLLEQFEERDTRLDYLRYQLEELQALGLTDGESTALEAEQRRLGNAQEILESSNELMGILGEDEHHDALTLVGDALTRAQQLAAYDGAFEEISRCLSNALIELEEAARSVRGLNDRFEVSPERLATVEARLSALHDMARKHRVALETLPAREQELAQEVERLSTVEAELRALEQRIGTAAAAYDAAAAQLSTARAAFCPVLTESVNALLADLGMRGARFSIALEASPGSETRSLFGTDRIEFQVATNAGYDPAPLRRIASGGELSRISLALQVAGANRLGSGTLIFDEVDVGIGGGVAERVGRRLREVGESRQVLCITHLPQVAAQATHHLRVRKREADNASLTALDVIGGTERVEEIARMLGGVEITDRTLAHAREMLALESTA